MNNWKRKNKTKPNKKKSSKIKKIARSTFVGGKLLSVI